MRATILFNNETMNFSSIKELKTFLNSALYYSNEVLLTVDFYDIHRYSCTNDIASLVRGSNFYEKPLFVTQVFE